MVQAIILRTSQVSTLPGLGQLNVDPLLDNSNGGVMFAWDAGFPGSWPGGAPTTAAVVTDISAHGNGDFNIVGGQAVAFGGNGFDYTGLTADPAEIRGPANLGAIFAGNQYFLVCGYAKMPASGDWNTNAALATMFETTGLNGGYPGAADLLTISQRNAPSFSARRQTNGGGTVVELTVVPTANHYGQFCQWAFWRNAAGVALRLKSALGTVISTGAVGAANSGNFSANRPRWGVPDAFNALSVTPAHQAAAKHRDYRGFIEDLQVSGRDPAAVLDADWTRTIARAVFS